MTDHPISVTYIDEQQARALAALPAAGAFDTDPLVEMYCSGFDDLMLFITYDEDAQATDGAVSFRIETSPDSAGAVWHRNTLYASGVVATNADSTSDVQREDIEYGVAGAGAAEYFVYGPIKLEGTIQRVRIPCAETGDAANPGDCEVEARFA